MEICLEERDTLFINDSLICVCSVSFYSLVPKPGKCFGSYTGLVLSDTASGSHLLQYDEGKTICCCFFPSTVRAIRSVTG